MADDGQSCSGGQDNSGRVLAEYESAWERAVGGGDIPLLDDYVQRVPAADRIAIREVLSAIAARYESARTNLPKGQVGHCPSETLGPGELANGAGDIPATSTRRMDRDLETICLKCLEKEPGKRYRSAAALADDLERYLRGEPIEGRPIGSAQRSWRWCQRNPLLATLGTALLLLLLTVAIGSSVAAYQINQQKNAAVLARHDAEAAQELAAESASIADQQRTLALDTLHNLVTSVEAKLHDRPDLADLQTQILQDAMSGLQEVSRTAETAGRAGPNSGRGPPAYCGDT